MKYPIAKIKRECIDEDLIEIDFGKLINLCVESIVPTYSGAKNKITLELRNGGDFSCRAIYLPSGYDWIIATDSGGELCLIPTRKE